ncbi:hypothetical protein HD806DRAFT_70692 [Xylariaceae sp. AK1471]|nr:hypothetical protein HD806DRAFT_70692 [Xylariaceae sp. AK1471]
MAYAYSTTIFEESTRAGSRPRTIPAQATYASIVHHSTTPLTSIPVDRSPRARPFAAFSSSVPTAPPASSRFYISPEEKAYAAANAAWVARQRSFYAMPGSCAGPLTPELRRWNGRVLGPPSPSSSSSSGLGSRFARHFQTMLDAMVNAARAEIVRETTVLAARKKDFAFWAARKNYHFIQHRRQAAFELREIAARIKPVLLIALFIFAVGYVALKVAVTMFEDRKLEGEIVYHFVKAPRVWSVADSS